MLEQKYELLGVWVSNAQLTLESIASSGAKMSEAANYSFGEMAYVFNIDETTFTPVGTEGTQERWLKWHIIESTPEYVVIEAFGLSGGVARVTFLKEHGCLGLRPEGREFTEYFCKNNENA